MNDFIDEIPETLLAEMLSDVFDKSHSIASIFIYDSVKKIVEQPDFILVDKSANDARTYIYTKRGNVVSQIMLHNWKGTIWRVRFLFEDDELRWLESTNSAYNLLDEGLYGIAKDGML